MCGGAGFKIKNISEEELKKYYTKELVQEYKESGIAKTFFWHEKAVLPINTNRGIQLMLWGNKDKNLKIPKTGWAREESLKEGKWNYLNPKIVKILINSGYEKKIWFDMPSGTKGIVITKNGVERVFIITKKSTNEYQKETGHDREPLGIKINYRKNL